MNVVSLDRLEALRGLKDEDRTTSWQLAPPPQLLHKERHTRSAPYSSTTVCSLSECVVFPRCHIQLGPNGSSLKLDLVVAEDALNHLSSRTLLHSAVTIRGSLLCGARLRVMSIVLVVVQRRREGHRLRARHTSLRVELHCARHKVVEVAVAV